MPAGCHPPPLIPRHPHRAGWQALWATVFLLSAARADAETGIEIAVAPYLPTPLLVKNFQPLRRYLEDRLHRPVIIVTAPDYRRYNERVARAEYPVIVAVANSAYLAQQEAGYRPLLRPARNTRPTLVVAADSSWTTLRQLHGQTIALPDPLAVLSMQAEALLRAAGLEAGRDITVRHVTTHATAIRLVATGEVAAAFVSDLAIRQLPAATRTAVRVVRSWDEHAVPGVIYMASPGLGADEVNRLRQAIADFANRDPVGHQLMKEWGYDGLLAAGAGDLEELAPYGKRLKEMLATHSQSGDRQ